MGIELKLLEIRKIAREHGKYVMGKLFDDYLTGWIDKIRIPSCSFCGSEENLTKEHIIPKWVFDSNPKKTFKSDVNQLDQSYIKSTIPLCGKCNSELFNAIEREVQKIISQVDLKKRFYSPEELIIIIRWLEIIDFKFQVWDLRTEFKRHKNAEFIPFLSDFSLAFMSGGTVRTVTTKARMAHKRIATKDKSKNISSLIVGTTKNQLFNYFHTSNEFIFLEIPLHNKCFFYFYNREFKNDNQAKRMAIKIIKSAFSNNESEKSTL